MFINESLYRHFSAGLVQLPVLIDLITISTENTRNNQFKKKITYGMVFKPQTKTPKQSNVTNGIRASRLKSMPFLSDELRFCIRG